MRFSNLFPNTFLLIMFPTLPKPHLQRQFPLSLIPTLSKLQILMSVLTLSLALLTNSSEILNLLRPHVEIAPNTDPFVILNHIFDTFRNLQSLLQLHSTDYQNLTLSTIHVNDFLKKLILLETPPQFTSS